MRAFDAYCIAMGELKNYCYEHADMEAVFDSDKYPCAVVFCPDGQTDLFEQNSSQEGEIGVLRVTVSADGTTVENTMNFAMDSTVLKKMIRMAQTVITLYYHTYRETEGKL